MAHYIAELIKAAEASAGGDRSAKMSECAAAILELWKHRSHLPPSRRPFENLEPVLGALKSLDPDAERVRYYYEYLHEGNQLEGEPEVRLWLRIVDQVNDSAKILIRYCLARASQSAREKSEPWVSLAEAAGLEDGVELPVIRFVKSEADLFEATELGSKDRKRIEDRIRRLERFRKTSEILLSDLRERLHIGRGGTGAHMATGSTASRKVRVAQTKAKNAPAKQTMVRKNKNSSDRPVKRGQNIISRTSGKQSTPKSKSKTPKK